MPICFKSFGLLAILALVPVGLTSAETTKRPFSRQDFDSWRSISNPVISRDGHFLAYAYMPQDGDGDVIVRDLSSGRELQVPAGALPPQPMNGSEADPERPAPRRSVAVAITSDNRFVIAGIFPRQAETLQVKRAGNKGAELPTESLAVIAVASAEVTVLPRVKSHSLPAKGGAWLAYLKTPPTSAPADQTTGSNLVLRDLATATERVFPNVTEYFWARDGQILVFIVSARNETETASLPSHRAIRRNLSHSRTDRDATCASPGTASKPRPSSSATAPTPAQSLPVWLCTTGPGAPPPPLRLFLPSIQPIFPSALLLVAMPRSPSRTMGGRYSSQPPRCRCHRIRASPRCPKRKKSPPISGAGMTTSSSRCKKVRAEKERRRAYVGLFDVATRRFHQLADAALPALTFNDDASLAFGLDDRPYRRRFDYDGLYQDLTLVNTTTGTRQLISRELGEKAGVRWSPDNRWLAWYADRQWFAADSRDGSVHALSLSLPYPMYDERADMPEPPGAHGTAGWTSDGGSLLIYDRYDLWQVFPDGRPAVNLTRGFGREHQIQLRLQRTEAIEPGDEKPGIELNRPLIFRGENEATGATGFFRITPGSPTAPERLLWADRDYRYVGRALAADTLLLIGQRFDEFPDILATNGNFEAPRKVSSGGTQLTPFVWGSDELIRYRNTDGVELSGMLCKPADFDPRKKYPMIVYIYERLSGNLNRFFPPTPSAVIDPSFYTSNGYVVLMPDIVYTTGHPGQSAYRCVMPAVDAVLRLGFVDENALGLEGHSWGGYETAYLITQTNRFRAAEAGAIVADMISANGAIGESSGRSRQFKYEKDQSRIGATIAEAPLLYLENSPVFYARQVNTPLLILHNDHDDIVPWPQAVEYFLALRREGKEVYLLNYNNDFHSPRRRAAQKDFARRMHQFFDHFLKGAPAPDWITNGIPYSDRDAEKLRFRDTP